MGLIRRVMGGLMASEIVSVQPMSQPSGLIFFLDYQYEYGGPPHIEQMEFGFSCVSSRRAINESDRDGNCPRNRRRDILFEDPKY